MIKRLIFTLYGFVDRILDVKKFFKFGITGLLNTGVDWIVFTLCFELIGLNKYFSQIASFTVSLINSFIINKNWAFKTNKGNSVKQFAGFFAVVTTSMLVSLLNMYILSDLLGINEYICKLISIPITVLINYFGNKIFVFK